MQRRGQRLSCSLLQRRSHINIQKILGKYKYGGAENAELDIARLDNAAPYRKGGQRET